MKMKTSQGKTVLKHDMLDSDIKVNYVHYCHESTIKPECQFVTYTNIEGSDLFLCSVDLKVDTYTEVSCGDSWDYIAGLYDYDPKYKR